MFEAEHKGCVIVEKMFRCVNTPEWRKNKSSKSPSNLTDLFPSFATFNEEGFYSKTVHKATIDLPLDVRLEIQTLGRL